MSRIKSFLGLGSTEPNIPTVDVASLAREVEEADQAARKVRSSALDQLVAAGMAADETGAARLLRAHAWLAGEGASVSAQAREARLCSILGIEPAFGLDERDFPKAERVDALMTGRYVERVNAARDAAGARKAELDRLAAAAKEAEEHEKREAERRDAEAREERYQAERSAQAEADAARNREANARLARERNERLEKGRAWIARGDVARARETTTTTEGA